LSELLAPAIEPPPAVTELAFIDTETSGLSGGTGTLVFLVGVGWVEPTRVRVRQYFLRDLHEEGALLEQLRQDLAPAQAVVTYNGRAFDLPLLNTRFLLQRLPSPLEKTPHLDLLLMARRLWRPRLHHCALSDLERHILKYRREEVDIPGWMVPGLYRDYLRTGDAATLQGVFYHNLHDILSLIALADIALRAWHDPWSEPALRPEDFVARARWLLADGRYEEAEALLRYALNHISMAEHRRHAFAFLTTLLKRTDRANEAVPLWKEWIREAPEEDLRPYEELAKYFEWQTHDLSTALEWTEKALAIRPHVGHLTQIRWRQAFEHRRARLLRRLQRQEG